MLRIKNIWLTLSLLLIFFLFLQKAAEAQTSVSQVMMPDFVALESAGLLSHSMPLSLGNDLYRGSKRSDLVALMHLIPAHSESFTMQALATRFLLTAADAGAIKNDTAPEAGSDLLTLRLEKLIERGLYDKAFDLYSSLSVAPYHERLARAGVLAMLGNGEKALACIEIKSLFTRFKEKTFWQEVNAYCSLTLSETLDEKYKSVIHQSQKSVLKLLTDWKAYRFPYTPEFYESISPLEKALVAAEGRLILSHFDSQSRSALPATHLQILLKNKSTDQKPMGYALLLAEGIKKGVLSPKDLDAYYKKMVDKAEKKQSLVPDDDPLAKLVLITYATPEKIDVFTFSSQIVETAHTHGPIFVTPFLSFLDSEHLQDISLEDTKNLLQAFFYAQKPVPVALIEKLGFFYSKMENKDGTISNLQAALNLMKLTSQEDQDHPIDIIDYFYKNELISTEEQQNIIENIDMPVNGHDNVSEVYENGFDKEINTEYIMPSFDIHKRLEETSYHHFLGETVVLSSLVLKTGGQTLLENAAFPLVLESFDKLGLNKETNRLAIEALLLD